MLVIGVLLCSCHTDTLKSAETTVSQTTAEQTITDFSIVSEGIAKAQIVRPKKSSDELMTAIDDFNDSISTYTGTSLTVITDWGDGCPEENLNIYEIVIGDSSYNETATIKNSLKYLQYEICLVDKNLIITCYDDSATINALNYFKKAIITKQGKDEGANKTIIFKETDNYLFGSSYRIKTLNLLGKNIGEYSIVIPQNYTISEYRTALFIKQHIMQNEGSILDIVYDNETEKENEILIGKTNRTTITTDTCSYIIKAENSKLQILAGNCYAYDSALEAFTEDLVSIKESSISIDSGILAQSDITATLSEGTQNILNCSGDVRIMSSNIWGNSSGSTTEFPIAQRNMQLSEIFLNYLPDVIALQECSPTARFGNTSIIKLLSGTYTEVAVTVNNQYNNNYTPLLYRSDILTVIDSGYHLYSGLNDVDSKSVTWAVFQDKDSGKTFAVCSTHFWYKAGTEGDEARENNAKDINTIVNQIESKYSCDVFICGDLNSSCSAKGTKTLIELGYKDAQLTATTTEDIKTSHSYPTYNADQNYWDGYTLPTALGANSIDHILLSGNSELVQFDVITDAFALLSSDHCPIYIDCVLQ